MLTHLKVSGFKSLQDVDVELAPLVVVLGPNAVGKSNFLEAVLLLSRLATERTLSDAFSSVLRGYPVEAFTLPDEGLQELLTRNSAELCLEVDIAPKSSNGKRLESLRYRVAARIQPAKGAVTVADEYLVRLKKDGTPKQKPRIEIDGEHMVVRRLGEAGQPRREDRGLNHTLASNLQFSGEHRYPDFDRLREELASWRMYYVDPRSAMREPHPPMEVDDIGSRGELLAPFLYRLQEDETHRRSFDAVRRGLQSAIPSIEGLEVVLEKQRGTLDIVIRQEGTPFSSRVISEGTLRVLALCAIAANPWPGRLVAFEEPENGVQPRRIETIAELLVSMSDHRQVLVTTHSPTLISALAQHNRERPDQIQLLHCVQEGRLTRIVPPQSSREA
jgi:predicted ATPase